MTFSDVRLYQWGDDVRNIDWNVTARSGETHIKIFEEDRELNVMLLVDVSGSAFFGGEMRAKQDLLTELCAVLAFSADQNQDKVGMLLFADKPLLYIPPKKNRQHVMLMLRELLSLQPHDRATNLSVALHFAQNVLKKRSVCFIISDFMTRGYDKALSVLSRRHDCIGLHCWDERERTLPDVGVLCLRDPESGQTTWADTTSPDFRRAYTASFDTQLARTRAVFQKAGADFLSLNTSQSYVQPLLAFFDRRAKRH
ncbi:MAG TPA: DUF58 domain-containing protein [Saprospiraceae bacterium]|nr:DUF58 domain-containing protein [Saprospiraceae bacterium]HND86754.1 DUF58 domain-containing protein [Saprospiraceae bacterium]HNG90017.1 DUF58 domain-containing protein [Saprospiraceae bacterium]